MKDIRDYSLLAHNTFGIDAKCKRFLEYSSVEEAQLIVVEGTLYPLLTRLKNDDLLSYEWVESTQGPPRKYYKLTEKGEAVKVATAFSLQAGSELAVQEVIADIRQKLDRKSVV